MSTVRVITFVSLFAVSLTACESSDTTEPTTEARNDIVVTGVVENRTSAETPDSARVLVAWIVSSGSPDYGYIFGEGEITAAGDSFRVALPAAPPEAALNLGGLGVGVIFVTTNQQIAEGDSLPELPESEMLGVAGWHGVIYFRDDPTDLVNLVDWAVDFSRGYSVGEGVRATSSVEFDGFRSVADDAATLIIDSLDNIDIVNWT